MKLIQAQIFTFGVRVAFIDCRIHKNKFKLCTLNSVDSTVKPHTTKQAVHEKMKNSDEMYV